MTHGCTFCINFYVDSFSVAATVAEFTYFLYIDMFLPRKNLGLGLRKINPLPWKSSGILLSLSVNTMK